MQAHTHTHSQSAPSIPTSKEALENCSAWSSTDQNKMDHPGYTIRERGTCQPCLSMWQTQNNKLHSDCPCPCPCPSLPSGRYQPNYNTKISLEKKSTCPTYPPFLYTFHHHEVKQLSSTRTKKMYSSIVPLHHSFPSTNSRRRDLSKILTPRNKQHATGMLLLMCGSPFIPTRSSH